MSHWNGAGIECRCTFKPAQLLAKIELSQGTLGADHDVAMIERG